MQLLIADLGYGIHLCLVKNAKFFRIEITDRKIRMKSDGLGRHASNHTLFAVLKICHLLSG